ncbi:MAG: ATP-dependent Clp protease ATP-binding subunit [Bacteroidaceae bacterium]|nr:ATP-dependent Clp protease ATP-binding subunit [Bacteroidaceae bacterium]
MENRISQKLNTILTLSKEEAERLSYPEVQPEHLLLGIIRDGHNKALELLVTLGVDITELRYLLESIQPTAEVAANKVPIERIALSETVTRLIKISILEARLQKKDEADVEHLLLAITRDRTSNTASILSSCSVDYHTLLEQITGASPKPATDGMGMTDEDDEDDDSLPSSTPQGGTPKAGKTATAQRSGSNTPVLDSFSTDMTQAALDGKLDPVVGRDNEIERLAQILTRRKKNNPILIGEPGVGKTAIVEGLAQRIVKRQVSRMLFGKKLLSLDMAAVVAGTKYRGQFEERLRSIIQELKKNPDIILFIDEIHTIIGAGSAAGSMDAANMLKPALSRGEIQCIGSTTIDEYRKSIEKDGALERRFQKILVEPTTPDETLQILENIKDRYEEHHNVSYTDDALKACVSLAQRYITDRSFPDKAIDVLDEAGSRTHLSNLSVPKEIEDKEREIDFTREGKNDAVSRQDFELAARFRDREKQLEAELEQMKKDWEQSLKSHRETVNEDNIADVVSMISGIPVQKIAREEGERLKSLAPALKSKVIAQDSAIDLLARAIRRSRVGLKNPNKPIGSFLFLGPTGVGKTLLAKELAEQMFGTSDALIRVDMSEFMEKFAVSRLVGAPPGYVGYEDGGQLTEKVRRKPYSIILLDEIEKAHQDVFNILLQVMDEGRLTDSESRTVDFRNTIIIMTSNLGSRQIQEYGRGIGFGTSDAGTDQARQDIIRKALNKSFAPEFINRIDEIITFNQLDREAVGHIVDIELSQLSERMHDMGYTLSVTDGAKSFLADKGYSREYGARPLKRAIQTYVEDKLAEVMIDGQCPEGSSLLVDANADNTDLTVTVGTK